MLWENITMAEIFSAMTLCDHLGMVKFRSRYGNFHEASDLHMYYPGRGPYEARPLIAAAYIHLYSAGAATKPLVSPDFNSTDAHDFLEGKGFTRRNI